MQKSGEPGYDFYMENMFTRGVSSFNSNQKMLIFVDGFEAPLDNLSSEEIESVSLLKDAAALAIYGSRGANGVLLITTKKGYRSAPKIGFRMQTGIQMPTVMDTPMNSADYAKLYNQALTNDNKRPLYDTDAFAAYETGSNGYLYPNVNWKKQVYRSTAPLTMGELSFRGGGDGLNYYVMAGLMNNGGLYRGTDSKKRENANVDYARYNFRANLDVDITRYFNAFLYSGVSFAEKNTPGGGGASDYLKSIWSTPPNAFPVYNPDGSIGGTSLYTNPVANLLNRGLNKENSRSMQVVFGLKYDFSALVRGLSAKVMFGYHNFMAETSPKSRNYARYALSQSGVDAQGEPVYTRARVQHPQLTVHTTKIPELRVQIYVPENFDQVTDIADNLKAGKAAVVNYERVAAEEQRRICDFVNGACYIVNGCAKRISEQIVLYAPEGVDVAEAMPAELKD